MKKLFVALVVLVAALFAVSSAKAGTFSTYLDYLNTDAIGSHPSPFVELDLGPNSTFGLLGGFAANRTTSYDFNWGVKLYSNDLYGQFLFNKDFDPALRVGVKTDIAESIVGFVGYEWLYDKADDFKFEAVDSGKIILGLGLRW